jgi:hypothetical protein
MTRLGAGVGCLVLILLSAGCGDGAASQAPNGPQPSTPAVTRALDLGVTLRELGFANGPIDAFSIPQSAVLITGADQPTGVTLVLADPPAAQLARYLRQTLPPEGFLITRDDRATTTITFTGYGWHGTFTGAQDTSGILLRP